MKNLIKYIFLITFLSLTFTNQASAESTSIIDLVDGGTAEGFANEWIVTNSNYLNITLQSTEKISARIESASSTIAVTLQPSTTASSTQFIISGLIASTVYYQYVDGLESVLEAVSDQNGVYAFKQDITQPHIIFLLPRKSTKIIKYDPNGGDCTLIGAWNYTTRTCTLTTDVFESINIGASYITLDGAGHTVYGSGFGIGVFSGGWSGTIKNINVKGFAYGIYNNWGANYFTVTNSKVDGGYYRGISIENSLGNTISNNEVMNVSGNGIALSGTKNNIVTNNFIHNSGISILLNGADNNTIEANTLSSNFTGVSIQLAGNNRIINNQITGSSFVGLDLRNMLSGNMFAGNIFTNNKAGLSISGDKDENFTTIINTTNIINGKPIYYLVGIRDQVYDMSTNAATLYCISCANVTIKNLILEENTTGIFLWKTTNSHIEGVNILKNFTGILLQYSDGNYIENSAVEKSEENNILLSHSKNNRLRNNTFSSARASGVLLQHSDYNTIDSNNISASGLTLLTSNNNTIRTNTISNNYHGLTLIASSTGNEIYNNNFLNNNFDVNSPALDAGNVFNASLPIGGNYWDDYHTPQQGCNDVDSGGFCDAPYKIYPAFSTTILGMDNFPWTAQDGWKNPQPPLPTILLPGILGSWTDNFFELFANPNPIEQNKLSLTEESQSWIWKQLDELGYLPHTWQLPKTFLPVTGHPTYKCPYDWRNNNQYNAGHYLIPCIDKAKQETGASKVNIVAHSMGGLVARAYVQNDALYRNDIARLAFVGTPNHGSPEAYYFWEGADLTHGWFGILGAVMEKVVGGRLFQMGVHYARMGTVAYAHGFFPSMRELLPTFDYLKDQFGNTRNIATMLWQNTLLKDINTLPSIAKLTNPVTSKVFAGENHQTLEKIPVLYPNPDNLAGNPLRPYPDGQPVPLLEENSLSGDGTVLSQKSAKITETDALFEIKTKMMGDPENFLEHTNLPNSFFNEILTFLGGTATTTPAYAPRFPDAMLAVSLASPADLLVIGPDDKKLGFDTPAQAEAYEITKGIYSGRNDLELAAIIDPQPGEYTVLVTGNDVGEFNTGISYAKKGCEGAFSQDNYGITATGTVTVFTLTVQGGCGKDAVAYSLDSTVDIDPDTLNLSSKGSYITAYIELPNFYKAEDINVSTIKFNGQIPVLSSPTGIGDYDNDGIRDLMVKFRRDEVQRTVTVGKNKVIVSGNLNDGTMFAGKSVLNVISNPPQQKLFSFFDFLFVLLGKFSLASVFSSFK